jgi:uncharacterized membrane protein
MRNLSNITLASILLAVQWRNVFAFTPSPSMKMSLRPLASSFAKPKFELFSTLDANEANETSNLDSNILKNFEKKEAKMQRRREEAMAKVSKFEETLNQLQNKKAEYLALAQLAEPPAGGSFTETTMRSVVKSFAWRVIAGSITFFTTLQFSGSMRTALQVVGSDFFSKSLTMFIGERLMNKSQKGRKSGGDSASRSLTKALIWRLFAIANTLTMAVLISKDLSVASKIASTDAVFKTALMFFYERFWARVEWGKDYVIEFTI